MPAITVSVYTPARKEEVMKRAYIRPKVVGTSSVHPC